LWVGTKKSAQAVLPKILEAVKSLMLLIVGSAVLLLTILKLKICHKNASFEDILQKADASHYIKKELNLSIK